MAESTRASGGSTAPHRTRPGGPGDLSRRAAGAMTWSPAGIGWPAGRWAATVLALAGAGLIVVSAVIHLHLWAGGYGGIAVIGPLFLGQGVAGIVLAVLLGVFRRVGLMIAGAGLLAGTAAGLLISVQAGLFGFTDSLAVPYAGLSLIVEFGGAGVLLAGAVLTLAARSSSAGGGTGRRLGGRGTARA